MIEFPQAIQVFVLAMLPVLMAILGGGWLLIVEVFNAVWVNRTWKYYALVALWGLVATVGGFFTISLRLPANLTENVMAWGALIFNIGLYLAAVVRARKEYVKN